MFRLAILVIVTAWLGACAADPDPPNPPQVSRTPEGECRSAAAQRAQDAGYNGFDARMQRRIYDRAYTDCANWARLHALEASEAR